MSGLEERVIKEGQRGHGGWGARLSGKKGGLQPVIGGGRVQ